MNCQAFNYNYFYLTLDVDEDLQGQLLLQNTNVDKFSLLNYIMHVIKPYIITFTTREDKRRLTQFFCASSSTFIFAGASACFTYRPQYFRIACKAYIDIHCNRLMAEIQKKFFFASTTCNVQHHCSQYGLERLNNKRFFF